jgi:hypothetical protein
MKNAVYCLAASEEQADAILTHMRHLDFRSSEVSILLKDKVTKNISVNEDVLRGAEKGSLIGGALGALAGLTALTIPVLGPILAAGPIVAAIGGAAVGGVVGGLAGGSGALTRFGVPRNAAPRLERMLSEGGILIVVHSSDPARLDKALRVFKSSGGDEIYAPEDLAA